MSSPAGSHGDGARVQLNVNPNFRGRITVWINDIVRATVANGVIFTPSRGHDDGPINLQIHGLPVSVGINSNPRTTDDQVAQTSNAKTHPPPPTLFSAAASLLGFLPRVKIEDLPDHEKSCFVCHERFPGSELRKPDTPILLRCGHVVGRGCIERWILGGHNSCPMCRGAMFEPARSGVERGAGVV